MTDAHCHLQDPAFAADLDQVLQRSRAAGVTRWVVNGTCPADWPRVAELAASVEGVLPQFGLHPWHADESSDWMPLLESYLERYPQAGVGEIGLDAKLTPIPLPQQLRAFRFQLRLAKRLQRPCTIHAIGVFPSLRDVLREEKPEQFLLHAFGGGPQLVKEFAALGADFSFGGALLRSTSRDDALRAVPPGRLHLESDAPFQHPLGKSHRSEPAQLADLARRLGELGVSLPGQNSLPPHFDAYSGALFRGPELPPWPEWGILTAENPGGVSLPAEENAARDRALKREMEEAGIPHLRLTGYSATDSYAERGWALACAPETLRTLAEKYGQLGVYEVREGELFLVYLQPFVSFPIGPFAPRFSTEN